MPIAKLSVLFLSLAVFAPQLSGQTNTDRMREPATGCYSNLPQRGPYDELSVMMPPIGSGTFQISKVGDHTAATFQEVGTLGELWLPVPIANLSPGENKPTLTFDLTVHRADLKSPLKFRRIVMKRLSADLVADGFLIHWGKFKKLFGEAERLYAKVSCN